jgi:hypothetical protein
MNKHTKIAILIAPILAIGGYILSDYYLTDQANEARIFQLEPQGHCDVISKKCILKSGEFEVNVYVENGETTVNSTFPIDDATVFVVDKHDQGQAFNLKMTDTPYYWHVKTPLPELLANKGNSQKLRIITSIKGSKYISEFYSQTIQ